MKASYYLPIAAAILIVLFYLWLPVLHVCAMPRKADEEKSGWLRHWFILALTAVYAVVAFVNLGETHAPKTYRGFQGESAVLRLSEPAPAGRVLLYTGIVQGTVSVEASMDGESWLPAATLDQNHAALLKWQELELTELPAGEIRALRITGEDGAELGEAAFFDASGRQILLLPGEDGAAVLCDEQGLAPEEQYYLNSSYFDEIYHARTAWEHLRGMYPYEVSHPPLGKLILSLGILLFGMNPFGWRFMGTLFGVLMLPVIYWFARRLFGGRAVPGCCAALLAADFMHFAQSRIATIDTYAVFFILLMFGFMLGWLQDGSRRDLALSGVFFGLGAASKWTCLYAGAGLGVLWLLAWIRRFREASRPVGKKAKKPERPDLAGELLHNIGFCLVFFVAIPALIYYLSYLPYGAARGCGPFSAAYAKIVWDNQTIRASARRTPIPPAGTSGCWTSARSCSTSSISTTGGAPASAPGSTRSSAGRGFSRSSCCSIRRSPAATARRASCCWASPHSFCPGSSSRARPTNTTISPAPSSSCLRSATSSPCCGTTRSAGGSPSTGYAP